MQSYYGFTDAGRIPIQQPATLTALKRRLMVNIGRVMRYTRTEVHAVPSQHILVRMLNDLNVDTTLDLFEYHRLVSLRADRIARSHGLTMHAHRGQVSASRFYGQGVSELLLYVDEDVDLLTVEKDWKKLTPLKVHGHPFNGCDLRPLDGKAYTGNGLAVLSIDILVLAIQYKCWLDVQRKAGVDFLGTPQQFVYAYPLANALVSHHEWAIVNRLSAIYLGTSLQRGFNNPWPFYLRNMTTELDNYLFNRISFFRTRSMRFEAMLKNVHLPVTRSLWELVSFPDMPLSRQNEWAWVMSRLPVLMFLIRIDYDSGSAANMKELSNVRKRMRQLRMDRTLDHALGRTHSFEVWRYIDLEILNYV